MKTVTNYLTVETKKINKEILQKSEAQVLCKLPRMNEQTLQKELI